MHPVPYIRLPRGLSGTKLAAGLLQALPLRAATRLEQLASTEATASAHVLGVSKIMAVGHTLAAVWCSGGSDDEEAQSDTPEDPHGERSTLSERYQAKRMSADEKATDRV